MSNKSQKKKCGGCEHWQKITLHNGNTSGLCQRHDWKCGSGFSCTKWSGIQYKRDFLINVKEVSDYDQF